MAEAEKYIFSYKEIAEALVKQQGIHKGIWGLYIEFTIGAANINTTPDDDAFLPAAIVPVKKIGLQKFNKINNLSIDAAEVNPK